MTPGFLLCAHFCCTHACNHLWRSYKKMHVYFLFSASISRHIMCHTVYIVTTTHIHMFKYLLSSLLFKRTAKIWIWIWALRWLMKPSRHWERAAADEILITGHRKRFMWAPRATNPSNPESHETCQEYVHIAACFRIIKVNGKVWTLSECAFLVIMTAPIHSRASIAEQVQISYYFFFFWF